MKVALDARLTRQMSVGMKAYAQELAARLPRIAPDLDFAIFREGANFGWDEQVGLPARIRRSGAQLTHFLSLYTPLIAPKPYAVTVHDLIHLRFPQYFKAKVLPYYHVHVRLVCSRASAVITDDERTVGDLERYLGVNPARVRVIPLGADDVFFREHAPFCGARPYVLYAGNHRPHKDLATLLAAWTSLPPEVEVDLYVTGPDDFGAAKLQREKGGVVALGEVDTAQLAAYYAGARALVHPALCEGFGLPMLEAMAQGCPVIACEDAIPGVLRSAALTFAARDVRGARDAMLRLLRDEGLRGALVNQGRMLSRELTWDRCAERTAQVYREMLGGVRGR